MGRISAELEDRIVGLIADGLKTHEIIKILGCDAATVHHARTAYYGTDMNSLSFRLARVEEYVKTLAMQMVRLTGEKKSVIDRLHKSAPKNKKPKS